MKNWTRNSPYHDNSANLYKLDFENVKILRYCYDELNKEIKRKLLVKKIVRDDIVETINGVVISAATRNKTDDIFIKHAVESEWEIMRNAQLYNATVSTYYGYAPFQTLPTLPTIVKRLSEYNKSTNGIWLHEYNLCATDTIMACKEIDLLNKISKRHRDRLFGIIGYEAKPICCNNQINHVYAYLENNTNNNKINTKRLLKLKKNDSKQGSYMELRLTSVIDSLFELTAAACLMLDEERENNFCIF